MSAEKYYLLDMVVLWHTQFTKPIAHTRSRQKHNMKWEEAHEVPPLTQNLLAIYGCWWEGE